MISGTIFEQTKLPVTTWFLAIHLITHAKTGLSALALKRQIGVSYNTAWGMKQKFMQVMKERDDGKPLSGVIQLDDLYWGGERRGGKRGRGSENKTPFVAAVALDGNGHPISMNMNVVKGFQATEIARWAKQHLEPGSLVYSDGLPCFSAVTAALCDHYSIVTGGGPQSVTRAEFAWVNTMIGNVKEPLMALTMPSTLNISIDTWRSFVTASTAGSNWKICCLGSLMSLLEPLPCRVGFSN